MKRRKTRILEGVCIAASVLSLFVVHIVAFFKINDSVSHGYFADRYPELAIVSLCARVIFLCNFGFLAYNWIATFMFLIKKKQEKLSEDDKNVSRAIPIYCLTLTVAYLYHEGASIISGGI